MSETVARVAFALSGNTRRFVPPKTPLAGSRDAANVVHHRAGTTGGARPGFGRGDGTGRRHPVRAGRGRILREAGSPDPGGPLPRMPCGRRGERKLAARFARGHSRWWRYRAGSRRRQSRRESAGRCGALRRPLSDAAHIAASGRRGQNACGVGPPRRSLGSRFGRTRLAGGKRIRSGSAIKTLELSAARRFATATSRRRRLDKNSGRSIPARQADRRGNQTSAARRSPNAAAPRDVRPDGLAPDAGRNRRVRFRQIDERLRKSRAPATGLAALRRALGAALAGPGAVRRNARARIRFRNSQRLSLPRLRDSRVERRSAVQPVRRRTYRGRFARTAPQSGRRQQRIDRGHRLVLFRRGRALAGGRAGRRSVADRQSDRRVRQDVSGADGQLRALPRPQVRRHLDQGLLRAGGLLAELALSAGAD